MEEVIWIGKYVPDRYAKLFERADKFIITQGQALQGSIIDALLTTDCPRVTVVGSPPMTDYSTITWCPTIRWRRGRTEGTAFGFLNVLGVRQIMITARVFTAAFYDALLVKKTRFALFIGDSYLPHLLVGFLIGKLFRVRCIAVVTDISGIAPIKEGFIRRFFRPVYRNGALCLIRSMSGRIVLNGTIADDFFPGKKSLVLNGIVRITTTRHIYSRHDCSDRLSLLYSGSLSRENGLETLLEAMALIKNANIILIVSGRGDLEELVKAAASSDKRIHFKGFLSEGEHRELIESVAICVSLRPKRFSHARYSFPSKILNFMAMGKCVLTNKFPGLSEELCECLVAIEDDSALGLARAIERIAESAPENYARIGSDARAYVGKMFTVGPVGKTIGEFVASIY